MVDDRLLTSRIPAAFGIVAYPSLGLYKSIRTAVKTKTRVSIMNARRQEASQLLSDSRNSQALDFQEGAIIDAFDKELSVQPATTKTAWGK